MRSFKDNRGRITAISVGWFHKISGEYYILGFEILVTASEVVGKKGRDGVERTGRGYSGQ